jgi:tripartite-type tricarboxylate transporter receptor subunit TctC
VVAPAGTPREIIDRVSADIARVVAMPDFRERLTSQGAELAGSSPEEAARFIRSEDARWGPLVKSLAVKPE